MEQLKSLQRHDTTRRMYAFHEHGITGFEIAITGFGSDCFFELKLGSDCDDA